jgi:hypothetical protein
MAHWLVHFDVFFDLLRMLCNEGATRLLIADSNEARVYDISEMSRTKPQALNPRCRFLPFDKAAITCSSQCLDLHVRS